MAFGTFFPSNHYTTAIKGKKRRRIERRKNWVLIDLDSAVSKGKYLGVKYYAHHLNHSNRYWWAHLIPFGIWIMNHLSLCVCLCASVFFLLPSIILSIRRKNDLLFVYFSSLGSHFIMIIKTARDRVQLFDGVRYNCRNSNADGGENKRETSTRKKDQLTGNWVVYWIWICSWFFFLL